LKPNVPTAAETAQLSLQNVGFRTRAPYSERQEKILEMLPASLSICLEKPVPIVIILNL
jgi:hypothetical protein